MRTALLTACGTAGGGAGIHRNQTGLWGHSRKRQNPAAPGYGMTGAIAKGKHCALQSAGAAVQASGTVHCAAQIL